MSEHTETRKVYDSWGRGVYVRDNALWRVTPHGSDHKVIDLSSEACDWLATALGAIPREKVTAELDKLHRIAVAREVTERDMQATIDALLTEGRDE